MGAGRQGLVVSLITERDINKVHAVEERLGRKLELRPTVEEEAIKLLSRTTKARQKAELLLSETGFEERADEHRETKKKKRVKKKSKNSKDKAATSETNLDDNGEDSDNENENEDDEGEKEEPSANEQV